MFEWGFKARCERIAAEKRFALNCGPKDRLSPFMLAEHLNIKVWTPVSIPGMDDQTLEVLLRNEPNTPSCWSAVTLVENGATVVILNSSHGSGRQASDLMHELSHRILGHKTQSVDVTVGGFLLLSSYDKLQEDEADWLCGSLLLPREALVDISRRKISEADAANEYGVSTSMLRYRMNVTGVRNRSA